MDMDYKLVLCDSETGAWSEINLDFHQPSHPQDKFQLVVTLSRSFLMKYPGPPVDEIQWNSLRVGSKYGITVNIWDTVLSEQGLRKVAEMHKFAKYPDEMATWYFKETGDQVVSVGCGNSTVISSWIGRSVRFDLLEKNWYELPFHDLEHLYANFDRKHGVVAGLVDF